MQTHVCKGKENPMTTQVLIVGAGPVGLTMAAELARYGVSVRIVDKAAQRTDKSKALVVWSRTLELLERGASIAPFIEAGLKATAANIIAGNKLIGHVDVTGVKSKYPYALMLAQNETERLLEAHLSSFAVQVERGVEVISFSNNKDGVSTVLRNQDGREETIETGWLIGCDGAHSVVRHAEGLSFLGETMKSDWMLADVHLKGFPFPHSEMATYWHKDGVLIVFPFLEAGRYRVVADLGPSDAGPAAEVTLDRVQKVIDERGPGGLIATDPVWLSAFRINERKVADYQSGRVFVAGDAAHVHSPAGGQGMNTGMQDAFNLAWKLALVCNGKCSDELLKSYSPERSEVGAQVLKSAGRLTTVGTLRNPIAQTLRNHAVQFLLGLSPVRDAMVDNMNELSVRYTKTPLNGPIATGIAGPKPGERVAPVEGQDPVGSGNAPRFALFAASSGDIDGLIESFPDLLDSNVRPPINEGGIWLVRPDGYVSCSARVADVKEIADFLLAFDFQAGAGVPSRRHAV
jgi:2-polyprenyl-6-methoxyphenol hydroxylase-like FAD-dependent oxidoreductase